MERVEHASGTGRLLGHDRGLQRSGPHVSNTGACRPERYAERSGHAGGGLYQAKKCAKHDRSLTWNRNGIQGPQGAQGPQGPGAHLISASAALGATTTGTIDGTWTYSLACTAASPYDQVDFKLTGPGVASLLGVDGNGVDGAAGEAPLGNGYERSFQGGPLVYTLVLQNGSTAVQAQLYVVGASPCTLFGSVIPLSTS